MTSGDGSAPINAERWHEMNVTFIVAYQPDADLTLIA